MTTTSGNSDLVNTEDSTKTIPTLAQNEEGYTKSTFTTNTWGYKNNNSNYLSFLPNTLLSSSDTVTNDIVSNLELAAKIDYLKEAGTYTTELNFMLVANPIITINDLTYMQDFATLTEEDRVAVLASMTVETSYKLKDSRDNREYYIAKLKDGNIWMVQDLRLGQDTTSLPLTTTDSDVPSSGFTLNGKLSNGRFTQATVNGTNNQNNSSQYYCTSNYGCYYNWYTATAGSGTTYVSSGNVNYSICPKGWTLPTQPQFSTLVTAYNNSAADLLVSPTNLKENTDGASVPGLLLNGLYYALGPLNVGSYGYYWSRTTYSAQNGHNLSLTTSEIYLANNSNKYVGNAVRCLLR